MDKNQKKNFALLGLSALALIFFIIASFGLGFRAEGSNTSTTLSDLGKATEGYPKDSYGLMVSGLVFISLTIILAAILVYLASNKANTQNKENTTKWLQITVYGLITLSCILVLAGELLFLTKEVSAWNSIPFAPHRTFSEFWNQGYVAGMLIFTLLPLPLLAVPCFAFKK